MTRRIHSEGGFVYYPYIPGGTPCGGIAQVHESSSADAPRLWLLVEQKSGRFAMLHMSVDAARTLIGDLTDLVEHIDGKQGGER